MKILLVLPKSSGYIGRISKSGKAGLARLSLSTLAALTPPEHEVFYHDSRLSEPDYYDGDWDLVGFTAMTAEIKSTYRMADKFREKGVKVAIGGYHASALPEEACEHADFIIVGEAEGVWQQALKELENGGLTRKIYKNKSFISMENKEIPRRDLLDREMYTTFASLQATRGCPFFCKFCTVTKFFGHSYRKRTVEEVIAELKSMPGEDWFFVDDNIVGDAAYAKELFKAMIPLKISWGGQASFNITRDPELMDLYAASGGKYVFIGFESISPETIKNMHKGSNNPEKYAQGIHDLHKRGITIIGGFVFGFDEDDISVFKRTVDFVNKSKIDVVMYNILTPFPGTDLFDEMKKEGRIHDLDWDHYDICHSVITPKKMTSRELYDGWAWATRETYKIGNLLKRIVRFDSSMKARVILSYSYLRKAHLLCPRPRHPEKYSHM